MNRSRQKFINDISAKMKRFNCPLYKITTLYYLHIPFFFKTFLCFSESHFSEKKTVSVKIQRKKKVRLRICVHTSVQWEEKGVNEPYLR